MTPAFRQGFMDKLAAISSLQDLDAFYKMLKNPVKKAEFIKAAGPSLRDKANAGVPGAAEKLKAQEATRAHRAAHPNPLGSLNEQKAYIKQQGQKNIAKLTPEQQAKFWQDANKFQADALRFRSLAGSMMPGIGLAGAAGVIGAGETAASGLEGKSIEEAVGRGTASGALAYGGGKALEYVIPRAIGYAATKVPWIEEHVPAVKRIFAPLRRYALAKNARDPFHHEKLTEVLNSDIPKYGPGDEASMYLTHSTGSYTRPPRGSDMGLPKYFADPAQKLDTALDFAKNGKYMPSMGLSDLGGTTWYSHGYGMPTASSTRAPVRYYFDESMLDTPRTVIFGSSDGFTPTYKVLADMVSEAGSSIKDPVARELAYGKLFDEAMHGKYPTISRSDAFDPKILDRVGPNPDLLLDDYRVNPGRVFEVKPYHDVATSDARAVSIGVDEAGNYPRKLERVLGDKGIPYYFVQEFPHRGSRSNGLRSNTWIKDFAKLPDYFLTPDEMAYHFAPKIKAK